MSWRWDPYKGRNKHLAGGIFLSPRDVPCAMLDAPRSHHQKPNKCHRMLSDCWSSTQDPEKHFRSPFPYSALAILLKPTENRQKRGGCLVFPRQGLRSLLSSDSRQVVKSLFKNWNKRLFKIFLALRMQLRGIKRALLFLDRETLTR